VSEFEWISVLLGIVTVIVVPVLVLLARLTVRWTRTEDRLDTLIDDVKELVEAKEKVHAEMYRTMREDRAATDRRLRWLEENLWATPRTPRAPRRT
jgi:hypothetical protein